METFTTFITFRDLAPTQIIKEHTPADKVQSTIIRLLRGPAAQMGMIEEVKIVDQLDCIVFLARDNKVLFPRPAEKSHK